MPRIVRLIAFVLLMGSTLRAHADGKVGVYGIYLIPNGADATEYSRPGWGVGIHIVAPVPQIGNILAGTAGFEFVNLLSETKVYRDPRTQLRTEQQTEQTYLRLFVGGQVGGHGNGFLRPHGGANIAIVYYGISTDVVVPDDFNREREIRQSLRNSGKVAFGYDVTLGLDLNFSNRIALDMGVRYMKSFSVPQQLGDGSVAISPQYFQAYFGIGVSFDMLSEL